jgi:DMSO reductase anchor subunit
MIYIDTRRPFWGASASLGKFFGTMLLLGGAAALVVARDTTPRAVAFPVAALALAKLVFEHRVLFRLNDPDASLLDPLRRSAALLTGPLGVWMRARIACGLLGAALLLAGHDLFFGGAAFALLLGGELIERHLFFRAEATPKMPGVGAA